MSILSHAESESQAVCLICEKPIPAKMLKRGAKYCSSKCSFRYNARFKRGLTLNSEERICPFCKTPFEVFTDKRKRYCSTTCRMRAERSTKEHPLSTGVIGAISELIVSGDLLSKGFEVYRAVSQASKSDLVIVIYPNTAYRVEVTTGTYSHSRAIIHPTKTSLKFDLLAVYVREDRSIHYFSDIRCREFVEDLNARPLGSNRSIKIEEAI